MIQLNEEDGEGHREDQRGRYQIAQIKSLLSLSALGLNNRTQDNQLG